MVQVNVGSQSRKRCARDDDGCGVGRMVGDQIGSFREKQKPRANGRGFSRGSGENGRLWERTETTGLGHRLITQKEGRLPDYGYRLFSAIKKLTPYYGKSFKARVGIGLGRGQIRVKNTNIYGLVKHDWPLLVTRILTSFIHSSKNFGVRKFHTCHISLLEKSSTPQSWMRSRFLRGWPGDFW